MKVSLEVLSLGSLLELCTQRNVLLLAGGWLSYKLLQALYNISPLHPLSHIPGSRLAGATYWPEFYHDVIRQGRYTEQIGKWHEQYGPIIRINPHELHCLDADFADEVYAVGGRKRDKPAHQINGAPLRQAGFSTIDHDLHRVRRTELAKFFSRGMIARLEGGIHDMVQQLCDKLLRSSGKGAFDVAMAYSCFTTDAISEYCFGEKIGFLDQDGWFPNFREPTVALLQPVFVFRFFPFLKRFDVIAEWLVDYLPRDIALLVRTLKIDIPKRVRADIDAGIQRERPTVFGSLLASNLEAHEKQPERLAEEAVAVMSAGTETTSWALAVITFHLLDKPELLQKLRAELSTVVDDPLHLPAWTTLEKLPYLGAVLQEGLRLSYGVSARTARVPTQESLFYRGEFNKKPVELVIPRGYAIGMSSALTHHDESVFPNSTAFIPERWLDENNERRKDVERGMMAFSKGSRACIGMNLAFCELHLVLTALALRVLPEMKLFETTEEDVRYDHDMFVPMPKKESQGVRVTIE